MTRWTEFPLRPQGQPWPGLNTRGGRLDPGQGYLEDGSVNAIINEGDLLEKRKGFVRGLDERFTGVVCGLFRYTDNCGIEYLIVADESGIQIRTPFSIPSFLGSDSLPFDDFESLDSTRWSNTALYEVYLGALQLLAGGGESLGSSDFTPAAQLMQWFKESVLTSYYVEVQYRMAVGFGVDQVVSVVVKRDTAGTTYFEAAVVLTSSTYRVVLSRVIGGTRTTMAESDLGGSELADGFLRLSYDAGSFTASATVTPSGGDIVTITGTVNEAQDAGFGQHSAIGMRRSTEGADPEIETVSGGQL